MSTKSYQPSNLRLEQGRFVVRTNDGQTVLARFSTHEEALRFAQQNVDLAVKKRP